MTRTYLQDAAKRRARRRGISYQKALQAITRFDSPRTGDPRNPAGIDWSPLIGIEATFANEHHTLRAVVLPPDGVRHGGDILRVAVTDPHTGPAAAEVTYLDARWWTISPMPDQVDQRYLPSRRKTRGTLGLPLYRGDNLPHTALATTTMLRTQHRLRPAEDQAPIAEYLAMTDCYPLYAIDDATAMPALSPKRQAKWLRLRTCARCGARSANPLYPGAEDQRYCTTCHPRAADDWWTERLTAARDVATTWARALLADPAAVVSEYDGGVIARLVIGNIHNGDLTHDLTTVPPVDHYVLPPDPHEIAACTPITDVADLLTTLTGHPVLSWSQSTRSFTRQLARRDLLPADAIPASTDITQMYAYWLQVPDHKQPGATFRWCTSWHGGISLRSVDRITDPADRCRETLRMLRAMAAGPPTDAELELVHQNSPRRSTIHVSARDLEQPTLGDTPAAAVP